MNFNVLYVILLSSAFIQFVELSGFYFHPTKRKTRDELKLDVGRAEDNLATICEMDVLILTNSRKYERCQRRCMRFKGYINDRDELICYSNTIPAVRISVDNKPCTCGNKYDKSSIKQHCVPLVRSEDILNNKKCEKECAKYTVFRLRKFNGSWLVIWCTEEKFEHSRIIRHLDRNLELIPGGDPNYPEYKCTCGLKYLKKKVYHAKKHIFNDVKYEEGNHIFKEVSHVGAAKKVDAQQSTDFSVQCSNGPFQIPAKRCDCPTFCDLAKGYFLPNSEELICYHDTKNSSSMPPLTRSDVAFKLYFHTISNITDIGKIKCTCGVMSNLKNHEYTPCIPEVKKENTKNIPLKTFRRSCENHCKTYVAYIVNSIPMQVVRCVPPEHLPEHTVTKLDSMLIANAAENHSKFGLVGCQCGLKKSSEDQNRNIDNATRSYEEEFNAEDLFDDIVNDPDFHNSMQSLSLPALPENINQQDTLVCSSSDLRNDSKRNLSDYEINCYRSAVKKRCLLPAERSPITQPNDQFQTIFATNDSSIDLYRSPTNCEDGMAYDEFPIDIFNELAASISSPKNLKDEIGLDKLKSPYIHPNNNCGNADSINLTTPVADFETPWPACENMEQNSINYSNANFS